MLTAVIALRRTGIPALILVAVLAASAAAEAPPGFSERFGDETLRIDYHHTGNAEFEAVSASLDDSRRRALATALGTLQAVGKDLLDTSLDFHYQQGWSKDKSLDEALEDGLKRDQLLGVTQSGPHRADLKIQFDERQARRLVSRGQQKLLASAMILAATQTAQVALERPLLLLLDDPAAELDAGALRRLMAAVAKLECQVVASSLEPEALPVPAGSALFHVEQGVLTPQHDA